VFPLAIRRAEAAKETLYDLIIPATLPGGAHLGDRLSITLLVNDNDGGGRKGWVEWTPGIGRSKDPTHINRLKFDEADRHNDLDLQQSKDYIRNSLLDTAPSTT